MLSSAVVKILGMVFKIPIQRLIGDEGMGYFNVAYSIYTWFYILSTAGLPTAVSVLVARGRAEGGKDLNGIYKTAAKLFSAIGLAFALTMILLARPLAQLTGVSDAYLSIRLIAPALLFTAVTSAVRGYYQGYGIMWPTGISQMAEAFGKLVFGMMFVMYGANRGYDVHILAALAIFGISAGSLLSCIICLLIKMFKREDRQTGAAVCGSVLSDIIKIALPVTLSSAVMNLSMLTDTFIGPLLLEGIGYTVRQATEIYGNYTTLAVSFFNLPGVFIYPIGYAISPIIASGVKNRELTAISAVKAAAIIAMPMGFGMGVLPKPLLDLLFTRDSAALAAPMLSLLSFSVFFSAMLTVTSAVLQASGRERLPLISMITGTVAKIITTVIFVNIPSVGRLGLPLGTGVFYVISSAVNLSFIIKGPGSLGTVVKAFLRIAVSSAISAGCAYFMYARILHLHRDFDILISIAIAAIVYIFSIIISGGLGREEMMLLPKGEAICKVLEKHKFFKLTALFNNERIAKNEGISH